MIVCIDTNTLVKWSSEKSDSMDKARLDQLFLDVVTAKGKVILPTPCLAEFLVRTDNSTSEWLANIEKRKSFQVVPFDRRSAFECSLLDRAAFGNGGKKGDRKDSWQKIKVDRQVIAVARANNATHLISDDAGLVASARKTELIVFSIAELPLPESAKQIKLDLGKS
jgi:predicted nucleic acid-binding protein